MYNLELIENVNYKTIGKMSLNVILPIGSHLIINNSEYLIITYVLMDYDINVYKVVLKKLNENRDISYNGKFF